MRNRRLMLIIAGITCLSSQARAASADPQQQPDSAPDTNQSAGKVAPPNDLASLRAIVEQQQQLLQAQEQSIHDLKARLDNLAAGSATSSPVIAADEAALLEQRGTGEPQGTGSQATVGEAPPENHNLENKAAAIPAGQGVLTPAGHFSFEPTLEYVATDNNQLTFSGIELVPGLQLGVITAQTAQRDTFFDTNTVRYGINSRLEIEVSVPVLYRHDDIQVVQQRDGEIVRTLNLKQVGIGDVEAGLRYQLNPASGPDKPIWILSLHVKSDTGIGPYDVGYDQFGIATGLATGSGFWGVEPGVSMLLPSDPVVIYASVNYLYQFKRDINKTIGGALVTNVTPGGSVLANVGFGFALNPRFSFSLGYSDTYIRPTVTDIGSGPERSTSLQIGTLDLGMSYRLSPKTSVNLTFQFGVTPDAPNLNITLRIPFSF